LKERSRAEEKYFSPAFFGVPGMGVFQGGEMSAPDLAVGTVAKDKETAVRHN
jgi:hypothetical protein